MFTPANRTVGAYTRIQVLNGQQSAPIAAPTGAEVSVQLAASTDPGGIGAGTLDYSLSNSAAVQGGTGTWVSAAQTFAASTTTPVKIYQDCWVRFNCTQGSMIITVDPYGQTQPVSLAPLNKPAVYSQDPSGNVVGFVLPSGYTTPLAQRTGIVLNGDSLVARNNTFYDTSQFTASQTGGVATIVLANHAIAPGTVIHMGGWTDARWNGYFTVLAAGMASGLFTFNIDPGADPTPTRGAYVPNFVIPTQKSHLGFLSWCSYSSGLDFNIVNNAALGSRVLSDMDTAFIADIAPTGAGYLLIQGGGTNDVKNGVPLAASVAALTSIIKKAQGIGMVVRLITVPPLAGATNTTAIANATLALNEQIRVLGKTYGCRVYDWFDIIQDPATSTSSAAANMLDADNVHPIAIANKLFAEQIVLPDLLQLGFGTPIDLVKNVGDTIGTLTSSSNILPAMSGTGGTPSGTASGSVLTNWTLSGSTTTCACSVVAAPVNSAQIVDFSGAAGSFSATGPSVSASFTTGDRLQLCGVVEVDTPTSYRMTVELEPAQAGLTAGVRAISGISSTTVLPGGKYRMVVYSEPWTVGAATYTGCRPNLTFVTNANGGRVKFYQFAVRKL